MRAKTTKTFLCLIFLLGAIPRATGDKRERYILKTQYIFENRSETMYNFTDEDTELPMFLENRWQKVSIRGSSHNIIGERPDEDGNPVAIIGLPHEISAGGTVVFWIEYLIESEARDRPQLDLEQSGSTEDIPLELVQEYTSETETFSRDEALMVLASELAINSTSVLETVTILLGWVVESVDYSNFEVPLYPEETLENLQGDCDDQAILLISMLRSLGIPAFLQIGVVFSETLSSMKSSWEDHLSFKQEGVGWHGWAMVYIPPWGWIPVDLTLASDPDPLNMIRKAPEYSKNIVASFNVSKQPYIGESRLSREKITQSDLYITISDTVIEGKKTSYGQTALYVGAGLAAGVAIIGVFILLSKRRY